VRRYVPILLAWLALALPLAQVAALSHELTHRDQSPAGTQHETKKGTHSGDCAKCLSYSAFAAGGAVTTPMALLPELQGTPPAERAVMDGRARLNFPYFSQAPPLLLV
jgi:hypothetical protein